MPVSVFSIVLLTMGMGKKIFYFLESDFLSETDFTVAVYLIVLGVVSFPPHGK